MQKTAKNVSLSIAGMMVAVPAGADIASIDYVQRWVQNQSPIPAGSVIAGYASGPYGSYLLAGTTVGGPYNAVSISDIGSKMSPYINVKSLGNGYSGNDGVLTAGGWLSYSYFGTQLASASVTGMGSILGTVIGSYIRGSQITGIPGENLSMSVRGYGSYFVMSSGSGIYNVSGSTVAIAFGSMISPYIVGSQVDGYNFSGVATGSSAYILAGSSTSGAASWMMISGGYGNGLTDHLFGGYTTGDVPRHILGSSSGGTGVVPGYYDISKMGTVIGTVSGNQVNFTQTASAETLQANTGTIYFPVVQNGTIYGVTLNDFYILMNAQF